MSLRKEMMTTRGNSKKRKINLTSVDFEPTTAELDLALATVTAHAWFRNARSWFPGKWKKRFVFSVIMSAHY